MKRQEAGADLITHAGRLLPDLQAVKERFGQDPAEVMARAFPESDPGLRPRAIIGDTTGLESGGVNELDEVLSKQRLTLFEAGIRAIEKLEEKGEDADLQADESVGLEAIVRFTARPAILVQAGSFPVPPPPWGVLEDFRPSIEATIRRVGRIGAAGLLSVPYCGTGFLVGEDVVITNCHVARLFSESQDGQAWAFRSGLRPSIDLAENPDADPPIEFAIDSVIGIHDRLDMALLRVSTGTGADGGLPEPLTIASEPPETEAGRSVYVLGYPAPDPGRNDPALMRLIFGDKYYVKRLQPGATISVGSGPVLKEKPCSISMVEGDVFDHDCSTLGGNSGSCVVDLESNQVLGLHFGGEYLKYNQAVALWKLKDDPLIMKAGVNFD